MTDVKLEEDFEEEQSEYQYLANLKKYIVAKQNNNNTDLYRNNYSK
jgi:hypothetical protein